MSMLTAFILLMSYITYDCIKGHRAYKLNELQKVQPEQLSVADQNACPAVKKEFTGHYAITHRESLTSLAKPKALAKRTPAPELVH